MHQVEVPRNALAWALALILLGPASIAEAQVPSAAPPSTPNGGAAGAAQAAPEGQAITNAQANPKPKAVAAQNPDDQAAASKPVTLSTVNVTGSYLTSIGLSTASKRDAVNFVDTIYGQGIGQFPDTNVAESLSRVPGVQITRDVNNEGMNVEIRGLGPSFTKIVINQDPVSMASSGSLDAQNDNREVDLDLLPPEFFTVLQVSKTSEASQTEGGVAGVVDMRTARPFDDPGAHLNYSVQGSYGSAGKDVKPRGAVLGSWTNADGTFGVLAGLTASRSDYDVRNAYETIGWTTPQLSAAQCGGTAGCSPPGGGWFIPATVPDGVGNGLVPGTPIDSQFLLAHNPGLSISQIANALIPRLGRPAYVTGYNDHQGALLSFEVRPSENLHFYLDTLFMKQERDFDRYDMDLVGRNGQMIPLDMQVDANGVVTSATFANSQYFLEMRPFREHVKFYNINPGGEWWFGPNQLFKLTFQAFAQRSWYTNDQPSLNVQTPLGQGITTVYNNSGGEFPDTETITGPSGDINLDSPSLGWQWYRLNLQKEKRVTSNKGTREDLRIGDDRNNVQVGISYNDDSRTIEGFDNSSAWQTAVESAIPNSALSSYLTSGPAPFIGIDYPLIMDQTDYNFYDANAPLSTGAATGAPSAAIAERTWAGYVEGNGTFDLGGHALRVNAGFRHAQTNQSVSGASQINGTVQFISLARKYGVTLPSFNVAFNATPDLVLRIAGSRTMTRPNPTSMAPGVNFTDPSAETATSGNPNLRPFISTNLDVGGEWYTGGAGYLGLDLFGKHIKGFTVNGVNLIPFTQLGVPFADLTPTQQAAINLRGGPNSAMVQVQQQVNADGTLHITGAELTWVRPLDFLTKGLGIQANYTDIQQKSVGSGVPAQAVGISPHTYSITGYWERFGASVRLEYTWNSAQISSGLNQNGLAFGQIKTDAHKELDLAVRYKLGWLPTQPEITLDAINLLKAKLRSTFTYDNATYTYYQPGYTIMLGVRGHL